MAKLDEVPQLIIEGKFDTMLDAIGHAIRSRREHMEARQATENLAKLKPGTRVVLRKLKPKYLNGMEGIVSDRPSRRPGDISVDMDYAPSDRYGTHLNVPAACLERIKTHA